MMKKIAVMLPFAYKGGTLQGVKNIVKMILIGASTKKDNICVVLSIPEGKYNIEEDFYDIINMDNLKIRETVWKIYERNEIIQICQFVGKSIDDFKYVKYSIPCDRMNDFYDCDFWFIVSDRINAPIFPLRPYGILVYDYIQRYVDIFNRDRFSDSPFIEQVRGADVVYVTTPQTGEDCAFYCGVSPSKIELLNAEVVLPKCEIKNINYKKFILWTRSITDHKNYMECLKVLDRYYNTFDGILDVVVIDVDMKSFDYRKNNKLNEWRYINSCRRYLAKSSWSDKIIFKGYVSEKEMDELLYNATFVICPDKTDNGRFCPTRAAYCGTITVSNDYPQMHFWNDVFHLSLHFSNFENSDATARLMKDCEINYKEYEKKLPSKSFLKNFEVNNQAVEFYERIIKRL